jgi:hypothetical protein
VTVASLPGKPQKAMILAAGKGDGAFIQLTSTTPKPLKKRRVCH